MQLPRYESSHKDPALALKVPTFHLCSLLAHMTPSDDTQSLDWANPNSHLPLLPCEANGAETDEVRVRIPAAPPAIARACGLLCSCVLTHAPCWCMLRSGPRPSWAFLGDHRVRAWRHRLGSKVYVFIGNNDYLQFNKLVLSKATWQVMGRLHNDSILGVRWEKK